MIIKYSLKLILYNKINRKDLFRKMSNYFGDLTSEYTEVHDKGFYGGLPVYIKVKSSPSDNVKLSHTYKLARSIETTKEDGVKVSYSAANGTHLKTTCYH